MNHFAPNAEKQRRALSRMAADLIRAANRERRKPPKPRREPEPAAPIRHGPWQPLKEGLRGLRLLRSR
jgi:hypothetical protein